MIQLDGSYLEGGGSLVRVALALSALTGKEFRVDKIRAGRPQPGLKAQHLTAIKALKEICNAETNDISLGSTELTFKPGKIKSGIYNIDIGTAGSITLLLQALILPCLFAPNKVTLKVKGGTCGKWQAGVDYLQNILIPHLQKFVEKINLKILKRGYYPKGGGEIQLEISPKFKLKDFTDLNGLLEELQVKTPLIKITEQGQLEQIRGVVNVSSSLSEKEVAERIAKSAQGSLVEYKVPINIRTEYTGSLNPGGEILLLGVFSKDGTVDPDNPVMLAGDALVERGKLSEEIGKEAATELKEQISLEGGVDKFLGDQLIFYMGLLPGSEILVSELTKHTETNIYVVESFLPVGFKVDRNIISVGKVSG